MKSLSDQVIHAIETCGLSRYRISQETGIDQSVLSRFVHTGTGLSLGSLNLVGDILRLRIEMVGPRKRDLAKPRRGSA